MTDIIPDDSTTASSSFSNKLQKAKVQSVNLPQDYGLGCIDPGDAPARSMAGVHNPFDLKDALNVALGIHARDLSRMLRFEGVIDVASNPDVMQLDAEKKFILQNAGDGIDNTYVCEEIIFFYGDTFEAEIIANAQSSDAPPSQLYIHDTSISPNVGTNSQPTGTIQQRVSNAAIASNGTVLQNDDKSSAWGINNVILPKASVTPIGDNSVASLESALQQGRGELTTQQSSVAGNIAIIGNQLDAAVCTEDGCGSAIASSNGTLSITTLDDLTSITNDSAKIYRILN